MVRGKVIEDNVLRLISIMILAVGMYVYARSSSVAKRLRDFYGQYPFIRYAGLKHLTVKPSLVRVFGLTLVIIGIICFFSLN